MADIPCSAARDISIHEQPPNQSAIFFLSNNAGELCVISLRASLVARGSAAPAKIDPRRFNLDLESPPLEGSAAPTPNCCLEASLSSDAGIILLLTRGSAVRADCRQPYHHHACSFLKKNTNQEYMTYISNSKLIAQPFYMSTMTRAGANNCSLPVYLPFFFSV